jgi:two-component system response regulator RegA
MEHAILIIDDEPPIRFALRRYFTSRGWAVDTAATPEEAEELVDGGPYEAAVVDLRLGAGIVGLDVVDSIRSRSPATRLVMLTAYGSREMEVEAKKRGVHAFLNKPKPLSKIAEVLEELLAVPEPSAGTVSEEATFDSDPRACR